MSATNSASPTHQLISISRSAHWNPEPHTIEPFLLGGADITLPALDGRSALHSFVQHGRLSIIELCLTTSSNIDFSRLDVMHATVLHHLCDYSIEAEKSEAILRLIIQRLETHPNDIIDWSQKDNRGRDFIRAAAFHQRLARFWPIVQDQPFFSDAVKPFDFPHQQVWRWDWETLSKDNSMSQSFYLERDAIIEADYPTARLVQCCWQTKNDLAEVRLLVRDGADIEFTPPGMIGSTLKQFVLSSAVECVRICLWDSPDLAPDFLSSRDALGRNIFACCLDKGKPIECVQFLLDSLLECIIAKFPYAIEQIEWDAARLWCGTRTSFLSLAATYGLLSIVWPILKAHQVRFFFRCPEEEKHQRFLLTGNVYVSDMDRLDLQDRQRFIFTNNVNLK